MFDVAKPFLKSPGGKTSLLSELLNRTPPGMKNYFEPFVGGGALFFELSNRGLFDSAVINDFNPHLHLAWHQLKFEPEKLIARLKKHKANDCHEYFLKMRERDPDKMKTVDHAAWFLYLNRTAFNGLWRVNKKGKFNVPYAHYKDPPICNVENLRACSKALQNTTVLGMDFEDALKTARRGDFAFFDPPYSDRTGNFVAYTKDGFTSEDQRRLRDCARRLKKIGVHVLLSNSDTEEIRELYAKGFKIEEVAGRRSIGAYGERRGHIGDLLIS